MICLSKRSNGQKSSEEDLTDPPLIVPWQPSLFEQTIFPLNEYSVQGKEFLVPTAE